MGRLTVVCLVVGALGAGCDVPPQVMLERAQLAQAGAEAPEKGCDCEGTEGCPNAEGAAEAAVAPTYKRVSVDGAPTAIFRHGSLRDADARSSEDALVTVAVFSDYQCPYCARGDATLKALAAEYGDRLRLVMKQMPLPMHANARKAALAALAAGDQGRYWEMHERLFQNMRKLDDASLETYAQELGLDLTRFRASLANPAHLERIAADMQEASALGVRGTPAFFINGRQIEGARSLADFKRAIDEELRRAEDVLATGVPRARLYGALMERIAAKQ